MGLSARGFPVRIAQEGRGSFEHLFRNEPVFGANPMNIFIAGGGRIGFHLTRLVCNEKHEVTLIETDPIKVEQVDYALDCRTVRGSAASVGLLQELGVDEADIFVSVTGNDEINLIAAAAAKGLGAKQAVARVDNPTYFESNMLYETLFGIDYVLSPDALTALEIAHYVESPGVVSAVDFGRGHVQMRQIRIAPSSNSNARPLKDIELPEGTLAGVVVRDGNAFIPDGDTVIKPGDTVAFVGNKDSMAKVQKLFKGSTPAIQKVVIMGGSTIGLHLAQVLENRQPSVKLMEWNMATCNAIAPRLKKTKVVCRDASSRDALEQEHVGGADMFIAATSDDERNIMACLLAKEVGVPTAISVVNQPDFASLVGKLGIDHAVTPRVSVANRVLRLIHHRTVSAMGVSADGSIEILEYDVSPKSPIIGKPLRDVRFPKQVLIGGIVRGEKVIVPRGEDALQAGDTVLVIANAKSIEAVEKLINR